MVEGKAVYPAAIRIFSGNFKGKINPFYAFNIITDHFIYSGNYAAISAVRIEGIIRTVSVSEGIWECILQSAPSSMPFLPLP
jgi:hypothetical protein